MSVDDGDRIKSHDEILDLVDNIKRFEEGFAEFELETVEEVKEELIEVDYKSLEPQQGLPEPEIVDKPKKLKFLKKKVKPIVEKPSATFRIRFNESGNLVNLDFKKPVPKPKKDKKKLSLKKILPGRKSKDKVESDSTKEKSSKVSKLKGGLGKIGKIKNVIPNKSKKSDSETEKSK